MHFWKIPGFPWIQRHTVSLRAEIGVEWRYESVDEDKNRTWTA